MDSPVSVLERSNNSVINYCCVFFLGFEATGACACATGATTIVPTGASSVSVSLEEETIQRLPGFLVGRWDEAIAESIKETDNECKVVFR